MEKIDELYGKIKAGSKKEAHEAARELKDFLYKGRDKVNQKKLIIKVLNDLEDIKDDNKAAAISAITWPVFILGNNFQDELSSLILKGIQHKKGEVRQQIRKLTSNFFVSLYSFGDKKTDNSKPIIFVTEELLSLSKKYKIKEGLKDEVYMEDLKPSVYKSIQLLLEDIIYSNRNLDILREAGVELALNLLDYDEDNEDAENEPLVLERKPLEYKLISLKKEVLKPLHMMARARLINELRKYYLGENKIKSIVYDLEGKDEEKVRSHFLNLMIDISAANKISDLNELGGVARETQSLSNHTVFKGGKKEPSISRYAQNIQRIKDEFGYQKPKDLDDYLTLCYKAHQKIDEFFDQLAKKRWEEQKKWNKLMEKYNTTEDIVTRHDVEQDKSTIASICHHALDWYLQEECNLAQKKTPEKLAMVAVQFVEKLNSELTDYKFHFVTNEEMAEFGGWSGASSLSSSLHSSFYSIIYAITDIDLMIVDHKMLKKNWEKRLFEIAPGLNPRSDFD